LDEDVEEEVDFEEYRLPELDKNKDKKPAEKKQEPKPGGQAGKEADDTKAHKPNSGDNAVEGIKPEPVEEKTGKESEAEQKPQGMTAGEEIPELSEKELSEVLEEKKTTSQAENKENKGARKAAKEPDNVPGSEQEREGKGVTPAEKKEERIQPALIERISTGIDGLDELVEGGFPANSLVLVKGCAGAGKSIFGMNFLMEGIGKGEKACYFSLEEPVEETIRQMSVFGWNLESLESEGKLALKQPELYEFDELLTLIEETVKGMKAKRLVFDSISVLGLYFQDDFKLRRALIGFERTIKRLGCTAVVLSESCAGFERDSCGVEEFVADGVIKLGLVEKESVFQRTLSVFKMRATSHSLRVHPFQIEPGKGIVVYPGEKVSGSF